MSFTPWAVKQSSEPPSAIVYDAAAPVGVFDSGLGGLSILQTIRAQLPCENLVYVADSANAPYGDKQPLFVEYRALQIVQFLVDGGAKAILIACNTATVVAIHEIRRRYAIPVIGLEPAIKPAVAASTNKVIGVLATSNTVASPSVARLCAEHGANAQILLQACPGLVEAIEKGQWREDSTRELLQSFLSPLLAAGADIVVLGCTHYQFVEPLIREIVGSKVAIVESSRAVVRELERRLGTNRNTTAGKYTLYSSTASSQTDRLFQSLLGEKVAVRQLPI
jgi:glutamate racemase